MTNKSPTLAQVEIALILGEVYGFAVFPVQPSGPNVKQPYSGFKWKEHSSADPIRIKAMWTSYPDGVPAIDCGKSDLIVVDADCKDGRTGVIEWELLDLIHTLPDTPIVETPSGGQHIWFRQRQGCERIGCGRGSLHKDIDVKGDGGYVLAAGASTEQGRYELISGDLSKIAELPEWLYDMLWRGKRNQSSVLRPDPSAHSDLFSRRVMEEVDRKDLERATAALHFVPSHERDTWLHVGMALKSRFGEEGRELWDKWSLTYPQKFDQADQERTWASFRNPWEEREGGHVRLATIFHLAKSGGYPNGPRRIWQGFRSACPSRYYREA